MITQQVRVVRGTSGYQYIRGMYETIKPNATQDYMPRNYSSSARILGRTCGTYQVRVRVVCVGRVLKITKQDTANTGS